MTATARFNRYSDVDWSTWTPVQRATLLFVVRDGKMLLIHKKRGLGAGKINGPGGRIDPGETSAQCAVREVQEELLVTPTGATPEGQLLFQFADGFSLHCFVFRATGCEGEPQETAEAVPHWIPLAEIPYERMWADDRIWLPHMIAGRKFIGRFLFDSDTMLGFDVEFDATWRSEWPPLP